MDILVLSWSPQCSRSYQKVYSGYSINSLGPKAMNVYSSRVPLSVAGTTCRHVSTASVPPPVCGFRPHTNPAPVQTVSSCHLEGQLELDG